MLISAEAVVAERKQQQQQPPSCSPPRAGAPAAQSRLHNFSFPTLSWGTLIWGKQRQLRCLKQEGEASGSQAAAAAAGKGKRPSSSPEKSPAEDSSRAAEASRPWNLRTRRAACNAPKTIGRPQQHRNPPSPSPTSPLPSPLAQDQNCPPGRPIRLRSEGKSERPKFSLALSREEIEEDFLFIKRTKPPRRPKKRARVVQRQLDSLFPGLWLSEVTLDSYKINDRGTNTS